VSSAAPSSRPATTRQRLAVAPPQRGMRLRQCCAGPHGADRLVPARCRAAVSSPFLQAGSTAHSTLVSNRFAAMAADWSGPSQERLLQLGRPGC
jgi:hypothetical protein